MEYPVTDVGPAGSGTENQALKKERKDEPKGRGDHLEAGGQRRYWRLHVTCRAQAWPSWWTLVPLAQVRKTEEKGVRGDGTMSSASVHAEWDEGDVK